MPRHKTGVAIARRFEKTGKTVKKWFARIVFRDESGKIKHVERKPEFNTKSRYTDAEEPLSSWFKRARKAQWHNLAEVKADYPHADLVGKCTVFNIGGNKYRLIVSINYRGQAIFIENVLTHMEYDGGEWKDAC
jgi:mRNA interferase HigB